MEHRQPAQTPNGVVEGSSCNGAVGLDLPVSVASESWLLEWGSPSDVLELTRAQILDELLRLRDDERQRIGQELHDSAGQLLVALQLDVALLRKAETDRGHQNLLAEIEDTVRLIGQEIRSLAFLNHPIRMDPSGLASALRTLVNGFGRRTGCHVSFEVTENQSLPDRGSSMALLRVAQEALVNVHRHAHASSVTAKLETRGSSLQLTITDDGVGMPSPKEMALHGGVGVEGMRFRVEQLGGQFQIAKLKRGTRIWASVPLPA